MKGIKVYVTTIARTFQPEQFIAVYGTFKKQKTHSGRNILTCGNARKETSIPQTRIAHTSCLSMKERFE